MGEGGEFIPVSSLERSFTVGKEVSRQEKINGVAEKAKHFDIFDNFETQEKRKAQLDEIVRHVSTVDGKVVFDGYEDLVNKSCDSSRDQTKVEETFDVLRRGFSLAINSDQRWQTSLNVGGLGEILPEAVKYDNQGHARLNLAEEILGVTITNPKIREVYRKASDIREKANLNTPEGKRTVVRGMESQYDQLIGLEEEAKRDGFEGEWTQASTYYNEAIGNLYGALTSQDGSVDKADESAITGSLAAVVKDLAGAVEGLSHVSQSQRGNESDGGGSRRRVPRREYEEAELIAIDESLDTPEEALDEVNRILNIMDGAPTEETTGINSISNDCNYLSKSVLSILKTKPDIVGLDPAKMNYSEIVTWAEARLSSHDSRIYMGKSDYKLGKDGLEASRGMILGKGRCLDQGRLTSLLRSCEKAGIPLSKTIDMVEMANVEYRSFLIEMSKSSLVSEEDKLKLNIDKLKDIDPELAKGTTVEGHCRGHYFDKDEIRRGIVAKYIIDKITSETGMDGKKAYQLAYEYMEATGEVSVFNFALDGDDELARCIHFGYFRKYYGALGRLEHVGPMSTVDSISSLTGGWLRHMSHKEGEVGPIKALYTKDIVVENNYNADDTLPFASYYNKYIKHLDKVRKALLSIEADPKMIKVGNDFLGLVVQSIDKIDPRNELVNIPGVGYRRVNVTYEYDSSSGRGDKKVFSIEGIAGQVAEVDGKYRFSYRSQVLELSSEKSRGGNLDLRANYGLGLLESIAVRGYEQWNGYSIMDLERAFVETDLSGMEPFLNKGMWKWINEQPVAHIEKSGGGFRNLTFKELFRSNQKRIDRKSFLEALAKVVQSGKV